ncbi:hypothetical protein SUGI_0064880 [Cryptomeria japonica]|nr:hypothetical protein SUGI_0064880 [Cryptomeria japonica]
MIGLGRATYTNDPIGIQLSIVVREHGTHPSSRTKKGSIACRKSEAPREPDAFRDEERKRKRARKAKPSPFRATKPCNRPIYIYGATVRCNTPRLPRVPRGRAKRSRGRGADYPPRGDKRQTAISERIATYRQHRRDPTSYPSSSLHSLLL